MPDLSLVDIDDLVAELSRRGSCGCIIVARPEKNDPDNFVDLRKMWGPYPHLIGLLTVVGDQLRDDYQEARRQGQG